MSDIEPKNGPKPITLKELHEKLVPQWKKEATEFEKAPVLPFEPGDTYQVRIKRVITGKFEEPLVILSEFSLLGETGEAGPIQKSEQRLPTFLVRRAMEKDVPLHEKQVYLAGYIADKATQAGQSDFKQGFVRLLGAEFLLE